MSTIDVRLIELEPMRMVSIWGFGKEPETEAWRKLEAWARPRGLRDDPESHRIFGFNNPDPCSGSPNYGYELWIEVGPDIEPEGDARIVQFRGGKYAVTRCPVPEGDIESIGRTWKQLVTWREENGYHMGHHQWLEKSVFVDEPGLLFTLDLYMPITE